MKKVIAPIVVAAICAALLAAAAPSRAPAAQDAHGGAGRVRRALDYLRSRQQKDGGFAEPGHSSDMNTAWAVAAIASAGEDPGIWRNKGNSPLDFLAQRVSGTSKLTDIEKVCLAVCSAGGDPGSFGGRDLVAEIEGRIKEDGRIGDMVNEHIWGIIALKAAGERIPDSCREWLKARQNVDGGFGFAVGGESDPDDTGAALQALIAAGEPAGGSAVRRALSYLRFCQADDGGFCWRSSASNVASTAWAVQGIAAAGEDPGSPAWSKNGRTPLDFLAGMQQADGHFKYMKNNDSQPVWMTAEAIPALLKRPYPLNLKAGSKSTGTESSSSRTPASPEPAPTPSLPGEPSDDATVSQENGEQAQSGEPGGGEETRGSTDGTPGSNSAERARIDGAESDSAGAEAANEVEDSGRKRLAVIVVTCTAALAFLIALILIYRWARGRTAS